MAIINSVIAGGGTTPTGTISITSNGTHDVTNYATADVNVPTTAPAHYIEKSVDANGKLQNGTLLISFTGVTEIGDNTLHHAFFYNTNITGNLDLSNIQKIGTGAMVSCFQYSGLNGSVDLSGVSYVGAYGLQYAFANTAITSVDLSNLVDAMACGNGAFSNAFGSITTLTSVNLSNLTKIGGGISFSGCRLTTLNLPKLELVGANGMQSFVENNSTLTSASMPLVNGNGGQRPFTACFKGCNLTTFKFESLSNITGIYSVAQTFANNLNLQSVWFYALNTSSFGNNTNQFNNMLSGVTGCTVHFPMAIQSTIGSWSDVTNGFSGTNTTVLFDIVTTLTGADGNTYTRQEKDSTTTATAWVYNDTLYYTSGVSDNDHGVNEPSVSDAIYSDAACQNSITTITAIS